MKFVRFISKDYPNGTYGLVADGGQVEVIRGGLLDPIERTGAVVNESEFLKYLAPVEPPNILAMALNYFEHAAEGNEKPPPEPALFLKATSCLTGHNDNIVLPKIAPDHSDYEAELCVVIGRKARNVPREKAMDYVFGYTCGNDVSARDCQVSDVQWSRAKSFDTYGCVGPYIVTDIDASDLKLEMRLNGNTMQSDSTKSLVYDIPTLVSVLSSWMTMLPETLIMTGTPGGVGNARNPKVLLRPGDICEIEIENVGLLRNTVVAEDAS